MKVRIEIFLNQSKFILLTILDFVSFKFIFKNNKILLDKEDNL